MVKCDCGKEFANGRALHAHKFHCKHKPPSNKVCDCKPGQEDLELLDKTNTAHAHWIAQVNPMTGKRYKKFCRACLEVV